MKTIFDEVSYACSKVTTRAYSTSFSLGIYCLHKKIRYPIYAIYGFVRYADEIVDSFHGYDKLTLLNDFKTDTYKAIQNKISLNPILNSFQHVVNSYNIDLQLVETFFKSMQMDLYEKQHDKKSYETYILGSAEVVGLMCLYVFTEGNVDLFERLKKPAMNLGAAFQKVNFLRDIRADYLQLGRSYFPSVNLEKFSDHDKKQIQADIENDFNEALKGIKLLPVVARFGVYVAYMYYKALFKKIKALPPNRILNERIRIPNYEKISLLIGTYFFYNIRKI